MNNYPLHKFHIPVMGLAYTIDSPVKVARYGISSVISIVEDRLIEMMRSYYYPTINQHYEPITTNEPDYRARRITDYLNLVNSIVHTQIEKIKKAAFEKGSEIVKYFEMLPEDSFLKQLYLKMVDTDNRTEREEMENYLRSQVKPGSIDVNIMTKVDRNNYDKNGKMIEDGSDAVAALRGYIKSDLSNSSIVFSAGMNPRLFNYMEQCREFDINEEGSFTKKVVLKVSDYRSALIQGKYLAKKGIWISEFRIESGLNCGGHAFASEGFLLGPILEEFKTKREELTASLFEIYSAAQHKKGTAVSETPPAIIITVQGGIGSSEENTFLLNKYDVNSTGWGSPFLLVPEATTVDDETLKLLCNAKETDVSLSRNSPLGVRFYYLKGTSSDREKATRIQQGKPGSPCTEKHLSFNTEFTKEPICTASHKYQKLKIAQLQEMNLPENEYKRQLAEIMDKECLCIGLSNAAAICYSETFVNKLTSVNVCPGPNIVNFSKVVSLKTMVDYIYGRDKTLTPEGRPHMFIAELNLYINYLKEQITEDIKTGQFSKKKKYYSSYFQNLKDGICYYKGLDDIAKQEGEQFFISLGEATEELDELNDKYELESSVMAIN
ncbi:MAG: hypothetical protein IPM85_01660 [Chitinophagaceae bacterium]|nr:hypothetical protein [Chitinophagaceae bacterium]